MDDWNRSERGKEEKKAEKEMVGHNALLDPVRKCKTETQYWPLRMNVSISARWHNMYDILKGYRFDVI